MHDLFYVAAFLSMILAPCLVTLARRDEDEA